jgi:uncharacterized protein
LINIIVYIVLGLFAGSVSGIIGIGGGVIIVPALVIFFGFSQHLAQGTTLALLIPPIGLLAAYTYYQKGFIDFYAALFICLGFFIGGLIGAKISVSLPTTILQKIFGGFVIIIGIYMFFKK